MSPSTTPPFCSLTRTAWMVPLTRPQTVTFCAMTLPSTCAPSLIWRSEARTSPSIRPKTCAGPLQSILPTIDMSEPMQEAVPAFVVGSDLAQAWSCGCTIPPMISAAFAAAFLSFSGALLLNNMSTSVFAGMQCRKGQVSRPAQAENSQVRMLSENRTAQTRTATTMEPTSASHSVYGAVSGISFPNDARIAAPASTLSLPSPYPAIVCEEKLGQL